MLPSFGIAILLSAGIAMHLLYLPLQPEAMRLVQIIDSIDCTGSCDVATSKVIKADANGCIQGLYGNTLQLSSSWENPSGEPSHQNVSVRHLTMSMPYILCHPVCCEGPSEDQFAKLVDFIDITYDDSRAFTS